MNNRSANLLMLTLLTSYGCGALGAAHLASARDAAVHRPAGGHACPVEHSGHSERSDKPGHDHEHCPTCQALAAMKAAAPIPADALSAPRGGARADWPIADAPAVDRGESPAAPRAPPARA